MTEMVVLLNGETIENESEVTINPSIQSLQVLVPMDKGMFYTLLIIEKYDSSPSSPRARTHLHELKINMSRKFPAGLTVIPLNTLPDSGYHQYILRWYRQKDSWALEKYINLKLDIQDRDSFDENDFCRKFGLEIVAESCFYSSTPALGP